MNKLEGGRDGIRCFRSLDIGKNSTNFDDDEVVDRLRGVEPLLHGVRMMV